jgi:serine/threonine-protein kinase
MPVCATCGTSYASTVRICVRDGTPLLSGRTDNQYLGTLLDGKYRIDAFISAGGMGSVYRAQHVMLDKTVAVKVIKNELVTSDEVVARFQREARAASNLHHPNIVSVYDLGQTADGTLYIAMEFIDGPSVKQVIRRNGPLAPRECVDILRQVASALSATHRKQIVHRDLKSDNLMLASEDGRTVAKLVDFGIAKTFDESSTQLTAAGYMLGTPHYMSPEQAGGHPVDHRADVYSLGVILYEMLTGELPFGETSLTSMLVKLATEMPPLPSLRRPDRPVPPALDAVAMRCLEKDPERRYQSADEFAEALKRASMEIDSPPATTYLPIPAAEATIVRPSGSREIVPPPTPTPSDRRVATAPVAAPRAGLGLAALVKIGAAVLAVGIVAVAAVVGIGRWRTPHPDTATAAAAQSAGPSVPPVIPPPAEAPAPSNADLVKPSPTVSQNVPRSQAAPRSTPTVSQAAPAPVPAPAPPAVTPSTPTAAAPVPVAPSGPSVAVTCQGASDVCEAIRAEIVRGLQAEAWSVGNPATAETAVTIKVALVSQTSSIQFGTPSMTRTYAVDLAGTSRGTALSMPATRVFAFDALFGRAVLQENARQLASGAVDAVRASAAKSRN